MESSKNKKKIVIIASAVFGLGLVLVALIMSSKQQSSTPSVSFSAEQVKQADGKNGNPCYVLLDGTVYEIKQGNKWKDGEHTTSEGQAYCGMDATDVIKKSPHGKSVLSLLTKVGKLQ